jgi:hypothetical protein
VWLRSSTPGCMEEGSTLYVRHTAVELNVLSQSTVTTKFARY